MAYTKTNWQDLPNQTTPINATNLNHIETGIEDNDKRLNGTSVSGDMVVSSIRTKNIFDNIFTQGHHTSTTATNRICNVGLTPIKSVSGKSYTLSTNLPNTFKWKIMNCSTNQLNPTILNDTSYVTSGSITINCTGDGYLIIIVGKSNDGNLTPSDIASYNFQIEEGSTATAYSEYQDLNPIFEPIPTTAFTNILTGSIDSNHSCKINNLVIINIRLNNVTMPSTGWKTLLNIATNYRPSSETYPIIQVPYTENLKLNATISTNGDIAINNQSASFGSNIILVQAMYYI